MHSEWEKGRRNLATGSINTLQTAPINEMLSFHFSRFCLSQSQGSRREREFCPLNLEVRDENEIFLSISQGSRRDRDIFFQVSCFEMGLRDEINQILTRIFEIEKSRYALDQTQTNKSLGFSYQQYHLSKSMLSLVKGGQEQDGQGGKDEI